MDTQRRTERIVVKTLIFFAILFGISLGTCGLTVSVQYGRSVETLAFLSLIGMALGLLGMALCGLIWLILAILSKPE